MLEALYSFLIASDGFILQEFVQLLSGFIAVSLRSLPWHCLPKEGMFPGKALLLLSNF